MPLFKRSFESKRKALGVKRDQKTGKLKSTIVNPKLRKLTNERTEKLIPLLKKSKKLSLLYKNKTELKKLDRFARSRLISDLVDTHSKITSIQADFLQKTNQIKQKRNSKRQETISKNLYHKLLRNASFSNYFYIRDPMVVRDVYLEYIKKHKIKRFEDLKVSQIDSILSEAAEKTEFYINKHKAN